MQCNLQTFSKLSLNVVETLLQHYIVSWDTPRRGLILWKILMIRTEIRVYTHITSGIRTSIILLYLKHGWWVSDKLSIMGGGYTVISGIILIMHCM